LADFLPVGLFLKARGEYFFTEVSKIWIFLGLKSGSVARVIWTSKFSLDANILARFGYFFQKLGDFFANHLVTLFSSPV
jgi:hypothetical protein